MRVFVRYDTPDEKEKTRRQRNEEAEQYTPELNIPITGLYLWETYHLICLSLSRTHDGICKMIPPTEWRAWLDLSGKIVNHVEYDILTAMDASFCEETNKELESKRIQQHEAREKEALKNRKKGKR